MTWLGNCSVWVGSNWIELCKLSQHRNSDQLEIRTKSTAGNKAKITQIQINFNSTPPFRRFSSPPATSNFSDNYKLILIYWANIYSRQFSMRVQISFSNRLALPQIISLLSSSAYRNFHNFLSLCFLIISNFIIVVCEHTKTPLNFATFTFSRFTLMMFTLSIHLHIVIVVLHMRYML